MFGHQEVNRTAKGKFPPNIYLVNVNKSAVFCGFIPIYWRNSNKKLKNYIFSGQNIPRCTKMKFSINDFFSKCDQIHSFLRIWSHLLKKFLTENFIFVQYLFSDWIRKYQSKWSYGIVLAQSVFTCSNSTSETTEKCMKSVQVENKTPEQRQWSRSDVLNSNNEQILPILLVFSLLTLDK